MFQQNKNSLFVYFYKNRLFYKCYQYEFLTHVKGMMIEELDYKKYMIENSVVFLYKQS